MILRAVHAGDLLGSSLAATWVVGAATSKAAMEKYPTLTQEIVARGIISWLLFLLFALVGAAIYLLRANGGISNTEKVGRRVTRAAISAGGWGLGAASLGMYYGVHPLLLVSIVIVTGFVADWITQAIGKIAAKIAENPIKAWRVYKTGRSEPDLDDTLRDIDSHSHRRRGGDN